MLDHLTHAQFLIGVTMIVLIGCCLLFLVIVLASAMFLGAHKREPGPFRFYFRWAERGPAPESHFSELDEWHAENRARLEVFKPGDVKVAEKQIEVRGTSPRNGDSK